HLLQTCTSADGLTYKYKRDAYEPPIVHVYRVCDDPDRDGIHLDVDNLNHWKPLCVPRGKVIVSTSNERIATPSVVKLSENVLHVKGLNDDTDSICARDS
ncbi:hypothetical protein PENTCL1PPCAC_455, partial [Pristionchus entomophagus]